MIYLDTMETEAQGLYLDIHTVERRGRGVVVSGTVGDGFYEGDVLIDMGAGCDVTFVDHWLGGNGFAPFLDRWGADALRRALLKAVPKTLLN